MRGGRDPLAGRNAESFSALFALAGSKQMDEERLGSRLGLSGHECTDLVERLHRGYLVDMVSHLEGDSPRITLRLTEEGEAALVGLLEKMCELPEPQA